MYDYIPMKFNFDYRRYGGDFYHYYCEALTAERKYFKVAKAGADGFFMEDYSISSLMSTMKKGSLINGMTLEELQDAYYSGSNEDVTVDIGDLL